MASGAELIRQVKERIEEVDPREVHDLVEAGRNGTVIVDVREQHEFEEAHLPGAKHVPRGHLESRIETRCARQVEASDPVLPVGQPLGARGGHDAAVSSVTRTSRR